MTIARCKGSAFGSLKLRYSNDSHLMTSGISHDRSPNAPSRNGDNSHSPVARIPQWTRNFWVRIILVLLGCSALGGGVLWRLNSRNYVDTDDAFIAAHITYVAPQIAGRIQAVDVDDHQKVPKDRYQFKSTSHQQAQYAQFLAQSRPARATLPSGQLRTAILSPR